MASCPAAAYAAAEKDSVSLAAPLVTQENIDAGAALQTDTVRFLGSATLISNMSPEASGNTTVFVVRDTTKSPGKGLNSANDIPAFKVTPEPAPHEIAAGAAQIHNAKVIHVQHDDRASNAEQFTLEPLDKGTLVVTTQLSACSLVFGTYIENGKEIQACAHIHPIRAPGDSGGVLEKKLRNSSYRIEKNAQGKIVATRAGSGPGLWKLGVFGRYELAEGCHSSVVGVRTDESQPFKFYSQDVAKANSRPVNSVCGVREIDTRSAAKSDPGCVIA